MSLRRVLSLLVAGAAVLAATRPSIAGAVFKSPAWISIESPVNPYDRATRGAALLVHARDVNGEVRATDLTGTAEGLVNGQRRSITLQFDALSQPNSFALRKQWPSEGTWLLRISVHETTALVTLDAAGNATARIPMRNTSDIPLPRAVTAKEVDSLLTAAKR